MEQAPRSRLIEHVLAIEEWFYRYLLIGGGRIWTSELDLTMPQFKMLVLVVGSHRGMAMTNLARAIDTNLSTATGIVDRLVARSLLRRVEDPNDRRRVLVQATKHGVAMVAGILQSGRGPLAQALERLTNEQLNIVAQAMDLLYGVMLDLPNASELKSE